MWLEWWTMGIISYHFIRVYCINCVFYVVHTLNRFRNNLVSQTFKVCMQLIPFARGTAGTIYYILACRDSILSEQESEARGIHLSMGPGAEQDSSKHSRHHVIQDWLILIDPWPGNMMFVLNYSCCFKQLWQVHAQQAYNAYSGISKGDRLF